MASSGMKGFYRQKKKGGVSKPSPAFSKKSTSASIAAAAAAAASSSFAGSGSAVIDLHGDWEEKEEVLGLLEQFDLDMRYGPCLGLTRIQRWDRASTMGLNPPVNVHSILLRSDPPAAVSVACLWEGRV